MQVIITVCAVALLAGVGVFAYTQLEMASDNEREADARERQVQLAERQARETKQREVDRDRTTRERRQRFLALRGEIERDIATQAEERLDDEGVTHGPLDVGCQVDGKRKYRCLLEGNADGEELALEYEATVDLAEGTYIWEQVE